MNFINLILVGSRVYDNENVSDVSIRCPEDLEYIKANWNTRFLPISLTQDNIVDFFWDFIIVSSFHNMNTLKYSFFKDEKDRKPFLSFYAKVSNLDQEFIIRADKRFKYAYECLTSCYKPFAILYWIDKVGNELKFNYLHELDNLINYLHCPSSFYLSRINDN